MTDLNATLFFKARLELTAHEPKKDLLWFLLCQIRDWMVPKWKRKNDPIPADNITWSGWKQGGLIQSEQRNVTLISAYHREADGMENWACRITENMTAEPGIAPREWTTELGFQQPRGGTAVISMILYYRDRPGFIGLCQPAPSPSIPGLIRKLVRTADIDCRLGTLPIRMEAVPVKSEDMPWFRSLVTDPERQLPVVYLSPCRLTAEGEEAAPLLDPAALVNIIGPNAMICYGETLETSRAMTADFPDGLGCYGGGIRIYAPHPVPDSQEDSYRHRFLPAAFLKEHGSEQVTEILRRSLAQDVHFYETMFRLEDCRRLQQKALMRYDLSVRQRRLEDELLLTADSKEKQLEAELHRVEEEQLNWLIEQERLETEIRELKERNYNLNQNCDYLRDEANRSADRQRALDEVRNCAAYPKTPREIADWFLRVYADRLAFTERGLTSLKDCRTDAAVLWSALYQMVTTVYELYNKGECSDIPKAFNETCSDFTLSRGQGSMTRQDKGLMSQYMDDYCGRKVNIEAHLKAGAKESDSHFIRVYYAYDTDTQKLVIGSCGAHLDNYSTRKLR